MPTYQFPLEEQDKYPGRINFLVMKTTGYGLTVNEVQNAQSSGSIDRKMNADNAADQTFLEGVLKSFSDLKDVGTQVWNAEMTKPKITYGRSVSLYLPQGIQVQDGVNFDNNVDFGVRGMGAFENSENIGGAIMRMANPMGEINSLTEALRNSPMKGQAAAVGAAAIAQRAGAVTGAVVSSALQTTTNPNTRAVFKSVPLREFTFSFKMMPQSLAEAEQIKNIVQLFREEIYPETYSVANTPIAYKFPNKFVTTVSYGKKKDKELGFQILPAYLRNMSTTYNGSSQSFYKDGNFSEIDLTLTLVESRTLSKQDITGEVSPTGATSPQQSWFDFITGQF